MITAKCENNECAWNGVDRYVLGHSNLVKCGKCGENCGLSNPQPDPPMPETPEAPS